ncbi:MAG TPA: propionate/acetate kinase, partial [Buttiauxella sp.]
IGENSILIRQLVTERLRVFGIKLDADKNNQSNRTGERIISSVNSPRACAVIPTNEEKMIALDALHLGKEHQLAEYA